LQGSRLGNILQPVCTLLYDLSIIFLQIGSWTEPHDGGFQYASDQELQYKALAM
jgi:hypothetical protein